MPTASPARERRAAACIAAMAADPAAKCRCSPVDTRTRYQGTYARHKRACRKTHAPAARCSCEPSYWSRGYDERTQRMVRTRMYPTAKAADNAGGDLGDQLAAGDIPTIETLRFAAAVDQFIRACRNGVALNKHRRPYKREAIADLESALTVHAVPTFGTRLFGSIRRGEMQLFVDELQMRAPQTPQGERKRGARLSGSRVRSVVNAIRSLYAWGIDRELADFDPAARVRLPPVDARPRVTLVPKPADMAARIDVLPLVRRRGGRSRTRPLVITPGDRLPYALALYAGARRAEIRTIEVCDFDIANKMVWLGVDEDGRKSEAALRGVPMLPRLAEIGRAALLESGRGRGGDHELLCIGDRVRGRNSGRLSFEALQTRADDIWETARMERFTAHQARHIFASWLDAAGVRPVVVSLLMGHRTAHRAPVDGGAEVTRRTYTHALENDLREGMQLLDTFISSSLKEAIAR